MQAANPGLVRDVGDLLSNNIEKKLKRLSMRIAPGQTRPASQSAFTGRAGSAGGDPTAAAATSAALAEELDSLTGAMDAPAEPTTVEHVRWVCCMRLDLDD